MEDQMSGRSKELEFSPGEGGGGRLLMDFYLDVIGSLCVSLISRVQIKSKSQENDN
jgi:hypothetical protein